MCSTDRTSSKWDSINRLKCETAVKKRQARIVDAQIFYKVWRWSQRRHPQKGKYWIANKYFHAVKGRAGHLQSNCKVRMEKSSTH
ncbi:MAG: hypothetical protein LBH04_06695 [Tannerellaceae bacterium]|nr:hypothetical protein [Tannerellaceae bacterium]